MLIKVLIILTLTINIASSNDFLTKNCRRYCDVNFNECLKNLISAKRLPKEYHRLKNGCYSENVQCHTQCTKQEISLSKDPSFKKLLELQEKFKYNNWYPYKKQKVKK